MRRFWCKPDFNRRTKAIESVENDPKRKVRGVPGASGVVAESSLMGVALVFGTNGGSILSKLLGG